MSKDFVTTLRLQLREAAEREAQRSRARRALPEVRLRPLAVTVALALLLVALVFAGVRLDDHRQVPTTVAPQIVARVALVDQGGRISSGFGSMWVADQAAGRVLRVTPTGATSAAIRVPGTIADLDAAEGAVWVLTDSRLYRIDPASNRVVARIVPPVPASNGGGLFAGKGVMWVTVGRSLMRVQPRTDAVDRSVDLLGRGGEQPRSGAVDANAIYVLRGDGEMLTLDARTGARRGLVRPAVPGDPLIAHDGRVLLESGSGVAAIDGRSGRLLWRTSLGDARINGVAGDARALWVQGTPTGGGRDQLWRLDAKGDVRGALPLPDIGVTGMAPLAGRVWLMAPTGTVTEVR
jgi:PQQ-like domain